MIIWFNKFILAPLRNKFLQLILFTYKSASWNQPDSTGVIRKNMVVKTQVGLEPMINVDLDFTLSYNSDK
jgi:hypothetical protein